MTHTHIFQIETAAGNLEGELSFNGTSTPPHVLITTNVDMEVAQLKKVEQFIEGLITLSKSCGTIENIEITKK